MFHNREDAGRQLAEKLLEYQGRSDVVVLALPRGGVPVAAEISQILNLPMDLFLVRKLGYPGQENLAMGAIAEGEKIVFNEDIIKNVSLERVQEVIEKEKAELGRQRLVYKNDRASQEIENKTVILVDDGIATGASMRAAIAVLQKEGIEKLVIASPVAASDTYRELAPLVNQIVSVIITDQLHSVGSWYEDFSQVMDQEVIKILTRRDEGKGKTLRRGL